MRFRLLLPTPLFEEMIAQARAELPNECCGILVGRLNGDRGIVERRYPLVNAAASPRDYLSDGESMFRAFRDYTERDLDVLAVYHSHPSSAPVPSRKDLEMNYSPDVVNLIIGLQDEQPSVRGWWLTADDYREAEWECVE
jgi:[CysO sulfur-carrier protein]-S-L-cysteine hydrolase